MSRLDWFLGRERLKNEIVELKVNLEIVKDKLSLRENQIIKAGEIVVEYKTKLSHKEVEISALKLQNRLLVKIPK